MREQKLEECTRAAYSSERALSGEETELLQKQILLDRKYGGPILTQHEENTKVAAGDTESLVNRCSGSCPASDRCLRERSLAYVTSEVFPYSVILYGLTSLI